MSGLAPPVQPPTSSCSHRHVLGMRVDGVTYESATRLVLEWAMKRESRFICAADVHMVMQAHDSAEFRKAVNGADLVVPDGMPLVCMLRALGLKSQGRVSGPDLMPAICAAAARSRIGVGFLGGTRQVLHRLVQQMQADLRDLDIRYAHSPPFRPFTAEENRRIAVRVRESGCQILFVGLGCPKQERWMAGQKGFVPAVMLGVGAAFDFISGEKRRAFRWMQRYGLEWAFCVAMEPRRLWFRHFYHNPRFLALAAAQLVRRRLAMGMKRL